MLISDEIYFFKKTLVSISSEVYSLTPRKYFPEEGKNVRKSSEKFKIILVAITLFSLLEVKSQK